MIHRQRKTPPILREHQTLQATVSLGYDGFVGERGSHLGCSRDRPKHGQGEGFVKRVPIACNQRQGADDAVRIGKRVGVTRSWCCLREQGEVGAERRPLRRHQRMSIEIGLFKNRIGKRPTRTKCGSMREEIAKDHRPVHQSRRKPRVKV